MSANCKIILKGNLGNDAKIIKGENGKEFVSIRIATTDSYINKETKEWKNKETLWHDVIIFKPSAIKFAKDMKQGERVHIEGTLSYKTVDSKEGYSIKQASIIGTYIAKAPLPEKEEERGE